jgi:hypothetical protein
MDGHLFSDRDCARPSFAQPKNSGKRNCVASMRAAQAPFIFVAKAREAL